MSIPVLVLLTVILLGGCAATIYSFVIASYLSPFPWVFYLSGGMVAIAISVAGIQHVLKSRERGEQHPPLVVAVEASARKVTINNFHIYESDFVE